MGSRGASGSETARDKAGGELFGHVLAPIEALRPRPQRRSGRMSRGAWAQKTRPAPRQLCPHATKAAAARAWGVYLLLNHILGRLHGHGGAAQRALPAIGPYRGVGARTPAALDGAVAGGHFVARHCRGVLGLHGTARRGCACGVRASAGWDEGCLRRRS